MAASSCRVVGLVLLLGLGYGLSGCTGDAGGAPTSSRGTPSASASRDPDVIDFGGLRDIRLGASLRALSAAGIVAVGGGACGPSFSGVPEASPVFDGDKLVLIWAYPPLRTPEGIMVGSTIEEARQAYPGGIELTPPDGSTTFPGLLVTGGDDQAYLLLYDPERGRVEKLIVGYERYAGLLFFNGFGTC